MFFFFLGQLYGFCCSLDNITLLSKQNEVKNEEKCMLQYQNLSKAIKIKSLLKVPPVSKTEIKIEINKNKSYRILIFVCESYLSLGPLGIDGKIFLISKNRFLNVTTLTFPAIEILD